MSVKYDQKFSRRFDSHKMHLLALLGLFTDRNDSFHYPFIYFKTSEIPTLSYIWSLKKVPLSGRASPYRLL